MRIRTGKAEAASRQLETAIKLQFLGGDPLAVHTLAAAAFAIFGDLVRAKNPGESWREMLVANSGLNRKATMAGMNAAANYLKHADKDADVVLEFDEVENDLIMFMATLESGALGQRLSRPMQAFQIWCMACHSEHFAKATEVIWPIKEMFPDWAGLTRAEQLQVGRKFINDVETGKLEITPAKAKL